MEGHHISCHDIRIGTCSFEMEWSERFKRSYRDKHVSHDLV